MPKNDGASAGQDTCEELAPVVRRPPKRVQPKANYLFSETVHAYGNGKATAAAEHLDIHESNVSRMCSGEKTVAFQHLLDLFEGCPEAFMAFARPLCDELGLSPPQPKSNPTFEDVKADCTAWVRREPLLWRMYTDDARKRRGWMPEQTESAVTAKEEGK